MSERARVPDEAVASVVAPNGRGAYRGKAGCKDVLCTQDGNPDRCYGWHCIHCDGPSNCQGDCSCREAASKREETG